jgi:dolichol-phosphate mannosyltransferase
MTTRTTEKVENLENPRTDQTKTEQTKTDSQTTLKPKKLISFVLPVHNEEGNIDLLFERIVNLQKDLPNYNFELIFINDFSKDGSLDKMLNLRSKHPTLVKVINFSRNYGHQIAVTAGQDYASGDAVIIMDTDLQDPPETCLELIRQWENGFEIVYAQRSQYKSTPLKQFYAFAFYRILKQIANVDIPVDTGDFRLISQKVNLEMRKYREKARFLRGISCLTGYKQTAVKFIRADRFSGKPTYTFSKSLKLAIDGITSFSLFPIRLIFLVANALMLIALGTFLIYIIYLLITKTAFTWSMAVILVGIILTAIQTYMLAILGEYIGRIFVQSLKRPLYTIDEVYGLELKPEMPTL